MGENFLPELYSMSIHPYLGPNFFLDENGNSIGSEIGSELACEDAYQDPLAESRLQPLKVALFLLLLYVAYYQFVMVKKPKVVCHDPIRMEDLKKHCPVFFEKYRFTPWAPNAYMQTIFRFLFQTLPAHERRREELTMKSDGGRVCLDWFNEKTDNQPTVLMLPGITGSSDEPYIRHWVQNMTELGYRSVVFNYRGCSYKLTTPRMYSGSEIDDFVEVVNHITTKLPKAPLIAVGTSMGTMILLKYSVKHKSPFRAMFLISTLWDSFDVDRSMYKPLCRYILSRALVNSYLGMIKENWSIFEESDKKGELPFDLHKALKIRDMRTLVDKVTAPMFGRANNKRMCEACYSHSQVDDLTVPILSLSAADDPLISPQAIPEEEAKRNTNLMLVTTERGGHIGFLEGMLPPFKKTLIDRALVQFARAVFEYGAFS